MDQKEAFLRSALIAPDERPLLLAVAQAPEDDGTRLVYADWLEEQGGPEATGRSEFLRVQYQLKTARRTNRLRSRDAKLRAELAPTWLSMIGDTPTWIRQRWGELVDEINAEDEYNRAEPRAIEVVNDQGLLDVRYDSLRQEWNSRALECLSSRTVAPVLRTLRLIGDGWAANGVRHIRLDALLQGHTFSNLTLFEVESELGEDGMPWIGGLDGEQGVLGRFLARAPVLRTLISPSAPDQTFFQQGNRPIEELRIVAGQEHQGFIRNLAQSTCFPRLRTLVWNDANHGYMDGWSKFCTPAEDYFALFKSPAIAGVVTLILRDVYVTPQQRRGLLAIRSQGVEITLIDNPYSRP
jgi:uncharacterized protein (TIGR02996 family)